MAVWALVSAGVVMCLSSHGTAEVSEGQPQELAQLSRSWPSRGSGLACICRHRIVTGCFTGSGVSIFRTPQNWRKEGLGAWERTALPVIHDRPDPTPKCLLFNSQRPVLPLKIRRARHQLCDLAGRSGLSGLWIPLVVVSKLLLQLPKFREG